jgi:hypothetical protein
MKWTSFCLLALTLCSLSASWAQTAVPGAEVRDPKGGNPAIHGSGTPNFLPTFTGDVNIANSRIFELPTVGSGFGGSATLLGIGTQNPQGTLNLNFGDTASQDSLLVGNCDIKCLALWDGGAAVDIQSHGAALYVNFAADQNVYLFAGGGGAGALGVGTDNATNILTVRPNAPTEPIADAWTTYSSRRWKQNVHPIDGALDKVEQLQGVYFDWRANGKHDLGLVAEDVAQVLPEVVAFESNGQDAKSVDYGRLTALLVEAIKAQQSEIIDLKARLGELNKKLSATQ